MTIIRTRFLLFCLATLAICAILLLSPSIQADDLPMQPIVFVDRDGDGLNDLSPDENGDGIPDNLKSRVQAPTESHPGRLPGKTINFFEQAGLTKGGLVSHSKAAAFGRRRAWVRALCDTRSNFDAGLGSGLGLSAGSAGGGACAGGVCLR